MLPPERAKIEAQMKQMGGVAGSAGIRTMKTSQNSSKEMMKDMNMKIKYSIVVRSRNNRPCVWMKFHFPATRRTWTK